MNRKQKISDKKSFEQAGKDLLRKVHEAEPDRRQEALASWQEIEAGLSRPHTSFRLRSRFIWSVAASIAVLLSVGLYFWTDGKKILPCRLLCLKITHLPCPVMKLF